MTAEEIVISDYIRNPQRVRIENHSALLFPDHFLPGILKDAYTLILKRASRGRSLDPVEIYQTEPDQLESFDSVISGLALFCQFSLNREADGKFPKAAREIKHRSLTTKPKNKLKTIISR